MKRLAEICLILTLACLSACGTPGIPLPPSLELARPVTDLRAARKGNRVLLTWSSPSRTTDGHNITHPGATEICRSVGQASSDCHSVAQIRPADLKNVANGRATYTDPIPGDEQAKNPTASVFYAVSVVNSYGRSAGLSNSVEVPAAPALPPPSDFRVSVSAEGIACEWSPGSIPDIPGLRFSYRIYRREGGSAKDSFAGEIPASSASATFVDHTFEWEKAYQYRATSVTYVARNGTELQVEGDDSSTANLVAHDIFPPAVPSGLQAVFSGPEPAIDLVCAPNIEPDLEGYNIYRHEGSSAPAKINSELVKSPAYRDAEIAPGHSYAYSISAVDVRGNESRPSEEASEAVPGQ